MISFLGITCHYLDSNWNLKNILLDFINLKGPHSGENIANAFSKCLQDMKILTKVNIFQYFNFFIIYIIKYK
jgi:hypothetical protein